MEFTQKNGLVIKENKLYLSVVGDLIKVQQIDKINNRLKCFNVSESCTSYHRIDTAIKDNKFTSEKY